MNIGGKQFMNLQEAVGWLLQNNALPFQCNVNFAANTEIAKTAIINPSPAQIKIGALVLFADSKVGTVSGLTSNGFMVADEYVNIKDALAYISSITINASGHLISTLSDGTTKDAGIIKQISSFSINGSQHLIANFNDGTTNDLGAIFTGNINITGNITASGTVTGGTVTGNNILEIMSGYSASSPTVSNYTKEMIYVGACKTGNKLTFVCNFYITKDVADSSAPSIVEFTIPTSVGAVLTPALIGGYGYLDQKVAAGFSTADSSIQIPIRMQKVSNAVLRISLSGAPLVVGTKYIIRYEVTFLLNSSLL